MFPAQVGKTKGILKNFVIEPFVPHKQVRTFWDARACLYCVCVVCRVCVACQCVHVNTCLHTCLSKNRGEINCSNISTETLISLL